MTLHFGILGPLEARRDHVQVELGPPKQKAVLAVLLISANQVVSLDRLIQMLWGDDVPARAQGTLQAYVHNLRKVLEPDRAVRSQAQVLVTRPPGYVVQVEPDSFDATRFEALAAEGHRLLSQAHAATAKEHLREALALWRGPALAEFAFEQFAQSATARLEEARAVVHEDLLEAELALGNHATVIGEITAAVGEYPLRERLWSLLMLALYRSGRQGEALRAFAMARHTLAEELGIDPSPALRALEAAILAQSPDLEFYPVGAVIGERGPAHLGRASVSVRSVKNPPLVGREKEFQSLMAAVSRAQLGSGGVVLISGEAGIGKTRLVEEMVDEAERAGSPVAWGRAHEQEGAPPCAPWAQVAENLIKRSDAQLLKEVLDGKASKLQSLLQEVDAFAGAVGECLDSPSGRSAFFEALTGFVLRIAETGVLIIVLEDLQWADRCSLQLLEHLASRVESSHVLVVASCRPPENFRDMPLAGSVGALARLPGFDWIELDGLRCAEVGRLLTESGARASAAQVCEIYARTDGNPFFVSDFARILANRDAPCPYQSGLIPSRGRALIRHWLNRVPKQTHHLLMVAAAMGRDFELATVAAATSSDLEEAIDWMQAAVLAGLVAEDPANPGMYRFCSGLVRDALCSELPGLRRSAFHAFAKRSTSEQLTLEPPLAGVEGADAERPGTNGATGPSGAASPGAAVSPEAAVSPGGAVSPGAAVGNPSSNGAAGPANRHEACG